MCQGHSWAGLGWPLHPAGLSGARVLQTSPLSSRVNAYILITQQSFNSRSFFPFNPPHQHCLAGWVTRIPALHSEPQLIPSTRHLPFLAVSLHSSLSTSLLNSPVPPATSSPWCGAVPRHAQPISSKATISGAPMPAHFSEGITSPPWHICGGKPRYQPRWCSQQ